MTQGTLGTLISAVPYGSDRKLAELQFSELLSLSEKAGVVDEATAVLALPHVTDLTKSIFGSSPYLTRLILKDPVQLIAFFNSDPQYSLFNLADILADRIVEAPGREGIMSALRHYKSSIALLTALADLGGVWPVMKVTSVLSEAADLVLGHATRFLFREAQKRGDYFPRDNENPVAHSGYIIIAMGKHGARELNYSSDIDLIAFYVAGQAELRDGITEQMFFVRLTRDLVKLIQEPTPEGYVFRMDLRLRPDPGATQVALSTGAAHDYYESFGQNWERAAMIKARAAAGDIAAGEQFLSELQPFTWRKYLDFAAIADIHSMKRQIHTHKGFGEVAVAGHNIKLGRGGIREIEFFAQTQQLIAGGRQSDLRIRKTVDALRQLAERGWIEEVARGELHDAYPFLRMVEHRLQMINDEQTQTLPKDDDGLACI